MTPTGSVGWWVRSARGGLAALGLLTTVGCAPPAANRSAPLLIESMNRTAELRARHVIELGPTPLFAPPREPLANGCSDAATSLPFAALRDNPFNADSFKNVPALAATLCSPLVQYNLLYVAKCALPKGDNLHLVDGNGKDILLEGDLGLAPQWKTGPCNGECQEWVSACMYALRNGYGVHVALWLEAGPIPDDPAIANYPIEEGAFYGNYFRGYRAGYGCRGRTYDAFATLFRRCAMPGSDCGDILAVGPCSREDGLKSELTAHFACEGRDPDGSYRECHNKLSDDSGHFDSTSELFHHAITVYLARPNFNPSCP